MPRIVLLSLIFLQLTFISRVSGYVIRHSVTPFCNIRSNGRKQAAIAIRGKNSFRIDSTSLLNTSETTDSGEEDTISNFFRKSSSISSNNEMVNLANVAGKELLSGMKRPYGKDEAWRHTNLRKLFAYNYKRPEVDYAAKLSRSSVEHLIDDACKESCLVFIDGAYASKLSSISKIPENVGASSLLHGIISSSGGAVQVEEMLKHVPDEKELPRDTFASDSLTALNMANMVDSAYIHIPTNTVVETPIQVLFCNTVAGSATSNAEEAAEAFGTYPRLMVRLDSGAELQLKQSFATIPVDSASQTPIEIEIEPVEELETAAAETVAVTAAAAAVETEGGGPGFVGSFTRIVLAEGAQLTHTYVQEVSQASRLVEVLAASVSGNSSYDVAAVQSGAVIGRINAHIELTDSNANCSLSGVTLAGKRQSLDIHSNILHDAPAANSEQQQRNVIADRGEAIFKGRIQIPKHAQLTDSAQLCRSIMLGQRARIIAMPTLEITADNVVCSHGASVQDLDENSMFYLAARGVDRQEARKLLLRGFVFDLLKENVMDARSSQRLIRKLESMYPKQYSDVVDPSGGSAQKFMSI